MSKKQQHIIYSHSVELEFYGQKENLFVQNRIADLVKDKLAPAMETLFDEQTASGKKIKIDSLEIDLGKINYANWEYALIDETIYKLRNKLNEIISFSNAAEVYEVSYKDDQPLVNNIQSTDETIAAIDSFLQTGMLPWNASGLNAADLLHTITAVAKNDRLSTAQKEKLLHSVFYKEETLKRFILQFLHEDLLDFSRYILKIADAVPLFEEYKKTIQQNGDFERSKTKMISLLLLLYSKAEKNIEITDQNATVIRSVLHNEFSMLNASALDKIAEANSDIRTLLKRSVFNRSPDKNIKPENKSQQLKKDGNAHPQNKRSRPGVRENENACFVNNAGIVILSPFLKQMFINLGLSTTKEFVSEDAQSRAVLLSQYLVTGKTEIPEHELLLNKILCGFPLDKTLPSQLELTEAEMIQGDQLLQSVLEYWKELKTTNTRSLQNTFLVRNGKLVNNKESWLLHVEYTSYDIMLQFLPWGIGIVYLPWMEKRLTVEWHA
jgi:hypothetical protein